MVTIQVRISDEDKKNAEAVLKALVLDITTAVRIFFKRITIDQAIPFPISTKRNLTVNGFTPEFEEEVIEASEEAEKGIGLSPIFDDMEDFIDYLHDSK